MFTPNRWTVDVFSLNAEYPAVFSRYIKRELEFSTEQEAKDAALTEIRSGAKYAYVYAWQDGCGQLIHMRAG